MNMQAAPWAIAIERQYGAFSCFTRSKYYRDRVSVGEDGWDFSRNLRAATPFAWARESHAAVVSASRSLPLDAMMRRELLPSNACWWWFEQPWTVGDEAVQGVLIAESERGWEFAAFSDETYVSGLGVAPPLGFATWWWGHGVTLHEFLRDPRIDTPDGKVLIETVTKFVLAACEWLQQRILRVGHEHIERHLRKRIARAHKLDDIGQDVQVIQLRRSESRPSSHLEGADAEWSCRWIVNGHWRNQPYKDGSKLIYIMPFVKGPADKPLRVPTRTVYAVTR